MIKEAIVVEGRDDTAAVLRALSADTIETHGFGISKETFEKLDRAYTDRGLIIFTDPDHAGEMIRRKLSERYPEAKHAFLDRGDAEKKGDIGIENAEPRAILDALSKAKAETRTPSGFFSAEDLIEAGLAGAPGASERRRKVGKALGIGYGNAAAFLKKLERCGITREEFERQLDK